MFGRQCCCSGCLNSFSWYLYILTSEITSELSPLSGKEHLNRCMHIKNTLHKLHHLDRFYNYNCCPAVVILFLGYAIYILRFSLFFILLFFMKGVITTRKNLDREAPGLAVNDDEKGMYTLTIEAADHGSPVQQTTATVNEISNSVLLTLLLHINVDKVKRNHMDKTSETTGQANHMDLCFPVFHF